MGSVPSVESQTIHKLSDFQKRWKCTVLLLVSDEEDLCVSTPRVTAAHIWALFACGVTRGRWELYVPDAFAPVSRSIYRADEEGCLKSDAPPLKQREGKSSLTIQFVEGQFVDSYDPTIENTFTKMITVNGQEYHLQLVDTAGQDEYSIFPQTYSIDINGYILVYSVTSNKSFEVVKVIHEKLLDMVGKVQVPIMLVGNKKDLHMERVISCEEGKALAESWNAAFMESSAKENQVMMRFLSLPLPLP
ncbi:GTP-binding protein Rheb-like, partial [Sinocyclocheilus rhinocerous]|uniref:GTP-binding protein Rheb-like n=1 Tax=Sinocyclocheilus rhinocerous TaxID=307959 RepID=UPI0007B83CB4